MLEAIKTDIERLIAAYEKEKAANSALQAELAKSRMIAETYEKQIDELKKKVSNLELQSAFTGSGSDNDAARKKVEKMIREIDKCIALMEE
ncbi:MAG: hypothetical protein MJZ07_04515 [Bacteroidales bacterium]|nr:hypothetical protein [Bacteroidales bacterium]